MLSKSLKKKLCCDNLTFFTFFKPWIRILNPDLIRMRIKLCCDNLTFFTFFKPWIRLLNPDLIRMRIKLCCDYLTFLTFFKPLDPDPDSETESGRPLNPDPIWIRIRNKFKVPEDCYAWINQIFIYC